MSNNALAQLPKLGQSIWYDFIRRDMLVDGTLERLIAEDRLAGMTTNPTIFSKAVEQSDLYDDEIRSASDSERPDEIFERIAIRDIQTAADFFKPVFESTGGRDGYVSIEVSPHLARDTEKTIDSARHLFSKCGRKNVMIKIPGTAEGLPAIETCLREGINVNVTLLFSVTRYQEVVEAWFRGLEARRDAGNSVDSIASVASFFVSRVDSLTDSLIDEKLGSLSGEDADRLNALKHFSGVANAKLAYRVFMEEIAGSERYGALENAMVQRPLWASTSTKDPSLPDVFYVEALIGKDTVNTLPPKTYEAYRESGEPAARIQDDVDAAVNGIEALEHFGIDFNAVTTQLEDEGVSKFSASYDELLKCIESKRERIGSN